MHERLRNARRLVGAKQAIKALQNGEGRLVYIAKDADAHVTQPIIESCRKSGVEVVEVDSKTELGRLCAIDVGASVAVIID